MSLASVWERRVARKGSNLLNTACWRIVRYAFIVDGYRNESLPPVDYMPACEIVDLYERHVGAQIDFMTFLYSEDEITCSRCAKILEFVGHYNSNTTKKLYPL